MNGLPLTTPPDAPLHLIFLDRQRSHRRRVDLATSAAEVAMLRGEYEVWVDPLGQRCETAVLCVPARLAERFVVGDAPAEFAYDLRPFVTTLALDVPGSRARAPAMIDLECGDERASFTARIAVVSGATTTLRVLPGACRARWSQWIALDGTGCLASEPCVGYAWPEPVRWARDSLVSLVVPTASIDATIERNGADARAGGLLWFVSLTDASKFAIAPDATDPQRFSATIPHGTYRVQWVSNASLPAEDYTLRSRLVVDRDVALRESATSALVQVTRVAAARGARVSLTPRPSLALRSLDDPGAALVWLGFDGVALRARVRPGNYALDAHAPIRGSDRSFARVDFAGTLRERVEVRANVSLSLDELAPVNVEVDPLLDGALLDPSRVVLRFVQVSSGATFEFRADLDAAAWLMPGRYHVESMGTDEVDSLWPPERARLVSDVEISGPTRVPIEIRSRRVRGVVTVDGAALPVERCSASPLLWVSSLLRAQSWPVPLAADGRFDVRVPLQGTALSLAPSSTMCADDLRSPLTLPPLNLRACSADP